jgi:hypothetical protein
MADRTEPEPYVELYVPPLTNVGWAKELVAQTIETIFVYLAPDGAHQLHPIHAPALRLGWRADLQPSDIIVATAERYGLTPILVHSTSWRMEQARVILTYVIAVSPPAVLNENLADDPVARSDLARGDAMGPPPEIGILQVIEHAFRHLSWLVKDDQAVKEALPNWVVFLDSYEPEPFRAFGPPGPPAPATSG